MSASQVKISQAIRMVTLAIRAKKVPMIEGSPAIGKSAIVKAIAKQFKLKLIDMRLSQCDPTDLLGFPRVIGNKAGYIPMDTFPLDTDTVPAGYDGWLLFLDEFTSAPRGVQAAAYKVTLDRMIGMHHLHPNCAVVCAGNKDSDGAIVEEMSTALQSRLIHLELVVDALEWIEWASAQNFDHRITSFIGFKPLNIYTFKPDHTDKTYAAPRTWDFANDLLKLFDVDDQDAIPMLSGTLSEGVAREFITFCKIYLNLPTIPDLVANPKGIAVPLEPSVLFALTGSIANHMSLVNIGPLLEFVKRLPVEFQIVCLKQALQRNKTLVQSQDFLKWVAESAVNLF